MKYIFIIALGLYGAFVFISHIYVKYKDIANEVQQEQENQKDKKEKKNTKRKERRKEIRKERKVLK